MSCPECERRGWLIAALAGHIEHTSLRGSELAALLMLSDRELIAAVAGSRRELIERGYARFDCRGAAAERTRARVSSICVHNERFPRQLMVLDQRSFALYVAGDLERFEELIEQPAVAIVGARRATTYGLEVARTLGRDLAAAGVTVISGMALGVDSAAHGGALSAKAQTVAVLAGSAELPYPRSKRALHRRLVDSAAVVSEFPPGVHARRWMFPARNRTIAGLAELTVVVEGGQRSGSLITASFAREFGREVGAIPGRVTAPQSVGTNSLLYDGAHLIRDAQDVLDVLFGVGVRTISARDRADTLEPHLRRIYDAVAAGDETVTALVESGIELQVATVALGQLELGGHLRRDLAGRYVAVA